MVVLVSGYVNEKVNVDGDGLCTVDAKMTLPCGLRLGRVDHYMLRSIKSIVNAYAKQVVFREKQIGKHILEIEIGQGFAGENPRTVTIEMVQS